MRMTYPSNETYRSQFRLFNDECEFRDITSLTQIRQDTYDMIIWDLTNTNLIHTIPDNTKNCSHNKVNTTCDKCGCYYGLIKYAPLNLLTDKILTELTFSHSTDHTIVVSHTPILPNRDLLVKTSKFYQLIYCNRNSSYHNKSRQFVKYLYHTTKHNNRLFNGKVIVGGNLSYFVKQATTPLLINPTKDYSIIPSTIIRDKDVRKLLGANDN